MIVPHACILSSVHQALDNRLFYREAHSLQQAGYEVTLVAVYDGDEVRDGIRILGLPQVPRWQRPLLWARLLRQAVAAEADIYHFHDPELLLVAPWLRLLTGKPTVYDVHEANPDFILPPIAALTRMAFSIPFALIIARAVRPCLSSSTICRPDACAARRRSACVAGMVALPGRHMPIASATQHMVLAVPRNEQEPQVGVAQSSSRR